MPDSDASERPAYGYGVKLVRGPFVRLPPHPDHCTDEDAFLRWARQLTQRGARLAADLFSGAGGLSLGLAQAGYTVAMGVDHDRKAVETHAHHFGGLSMDWDMADPLVIERIACLLREAKVELLAGGPPCQPFSKAGRSRIRHHVSTGKREAYDPRRDLWRSYLDVIRLARPPAVLMENVPDMALDREMLILRTMVHELESLGYAVEERVVDTFRYGVPQFRQRLILVALHKRTAFRWPQESIERVSVDAAIGDLPEVEGGWRPTEGAAGWLAYTAPLNDFQKVMRAHVPPEEAGRIYDHITRPVRDDDRLAFEQMTSHTRYSQLPDELKRYRDDIFDDKYKRLDGESLSRTITAHIAKDGYWYIHPRQSRTLTVREAARLQTFPDHVRFAGPPSAAFRQIGNAVPPALGEHLGRALIAALDEGRPAEHSTREVAHQLATWWSTRSPCEMAMPWLAAANRWQLLCAEMLLDRAPRRTVRELWPVIQALGAPEDPDGDDSFEDLVAAGAGIGRTSKSTALSEVRDYLQEHPGALEEEEPGAQQIPHLSTTLVDLAVLTSPQGDPLTAELPVLVSKGVLRVAHRFLGEPVHEQNRLSHGRMAVARMIGGGEDARSAHLGLIELAGSLCRPDRPLCSSCPLVGMCLRQGVRENDTLMLF